MLETTSMFTPGLPNLGALAPSIVVSPFSQPSLGQYSYYRQPPAALAVPRAELVEEGGDNYPDPIPQEILPVPAGYGTEPHVRPATHPATAIGSTVLSEGLRQYVSESDLAANAQRYPEMQMSFTGRDARLRDAVKEHLSEIPAVHTFKRRSSTPTMLAEGLYPAKELPSEYVTQTRQLDTSVGLGEYVFSHWGEVGIGEYGLYNLLLDLDSVLARSVVTQRDICEFVHGPDLLETFENQTPGLQEQVRQRYFGMMVRGEDWKEITARRITKNLNNGQKYPLELQQMSLGELKHLGHIPATAVIGTVGLVNDQSSAPHESVDAFNERMLTLGFIAHTITRYLRATNPSSQEDGRRQVYVAQNVWRKLQQVSA